MEIFMHWEQQSLLFWIILNIITASDMTLKIFLIEFEELTFFLLETFSIT